MLYNIRTYKYNLYCASTPKQKELVHSVVKVEFGKWGILGSVVVAQHEENNHN